MILVDAPGFSLTLSSRVVTGLLPGVRRELKRWQSRLTGFTNKELARQAALSLRHKRFHCQGGAVYALYHGKLNYDILRLIVALQTVSDYLDNLCDRAGCQDAAAFRTLHQAMICAVDLDEPLVDFYASYPLRGDGGYLESLVQECRSVLRLLPSYPIVQQPLRAYASLYSDLQVKKHVDRPLREPLLTEWFGKHKNRYPELHWWEFAASTGSTLGIFVLAAMASRPGLTPDQVVLVNEAYFPWITGLHILLDYLIDQDEDKDGGDLNFVSYYPNRETARERLLLFLRRGLAGGAALPKPLFQRSIIYGLLALYLTDPKVKQQGLGSLAAALSREGGISARLWFMLCQSLRRFAIV